MKSLIRRIEALEKNSSNSVSNKMDLRQKRAREIQEQTGQNFAACWFQAGGEMKMITTIAEIDEIVSSARAEGWEPRDPAELEKLGWPYSSERLYNLPPETLALE